MRRAILLLSLAASLSSIAHATTYYFSTSGNDNNNGLSETYPKRSLNLVPSLLTPGDTILLKRDHVWYDDSLSWVFYDKIGTSSLPMLIGAYGTGARPVVAFMASSTWMRDSAGFYSGLPNWNRGPTDTLDQVYRLYLGGTPLPRVPSPDSLLDSTYCVAGIRVRVRCDDCDSAVTVEYIRNAAGFIRGKNVHYLTFKNLAIKGVPDWVAMLLEVPTSHVTIDSIYLHQFIHYGIEFGVPATCDTSGCTRITTTDKHSNVNILNCVIDKSWTERMNHEGRYGVWSAIRTAYDSLGANDEPPGGDGICFSDAVDSAVVRGCVVTNMGHFGIANELWNPENFGTKHILIEQNTVSAGTSSKCRAIGLGSTERCANNIVRRNYLRDQNGCSSFNGESLYVYSNIFETTKDNPVSQYYQALMSWISVGGGWNPRSVVKGCVFANNTLADADALFTMSGFNNDSSLASPNRFCNNLLTDWRGLPYPGRNDPERNSAVVMDSVAVDSWTLRNNGFWKSAADSIVFTLYASGSFQEYTAAGLNARPNSSANMTANPVFATGDSAGRFQLTESSPFVSGGISLSELLPAGMEAVDYEGRKFGATPSVGAFQYPFTALDSVSISGAPGGPIEAGSAINLSASLDPGGADVKSYAWAVWSDSDTVATGTQSTLADTLTDPATYTVSLVVTDRLGYVRTAPEVYVTVVRDSIRPAPADLAVTGLGKTTVTVSWTAPGDDSLSGRATTYDLRYSMSTITAANFQNATRATIAAPDTAGSEECAAVSGLSSCTTYYFALKTEDEEGNWSALSDVPNGKTRCSGSTEVGCDGGGEKAREAEDEDRKLPVSLALHQNQPNPFRSTTSIRFDLPVPSQVQLEVFDMQGRRVRMLVEGSLPAGYQSVPWDQKDTSGNHMKPGVYLYRLRAGSYRAQMKMVLLP